MERYEKKLLNPAKHEHYADLMTPDFLTNFFNLSSIKIAVKGLQKNEVIGIFLFFLNINSRGGDVLLNISPVESKGYLIGFTFIICFLLFE